MRSTAHDSQGDRLAEQAAPGSKVWRRDVSGQCLKAVGEVGAGCPACRPGLTYGILYFNDGKFLDMLLQRWSVLPEDLKSSIEFTVVDDGSPFETSAAQVLLNFKGPRPKVRLLVIQPPKKPWNQPGARNLLMHVARCQVLSHDVDHVAPEQMLWDIQKAAQTNTKISRLSRTGLSSSPSGFFASRDKFWSVGGQDEDFAGHYGSEDVAFFWRVGKAGMQAGILATNSSLEFLPQSQPQSQHRYSRDTLYNSDLARKKEGGKMAWAEVYLRFDWNDTVV